MKLKPLAVGLSAGIIWGVAIMLVTWWAMILGATGNTIQALGVVYLGYSLSIVGSIIGLIWGFADGFIGGFLFALLYNVFAREKP